MARKTLEMMYQGEVYDHEWNGFFRYATRRDWSEPHYEKMLEDEAGLLRNALALYRVAGSGEHRPIAEGIVEYVEWKLRDKERGFFYGSQDADEEFYKLTADQRAEHDEPYIDHTAYTSWNAQMISAYLEASWTLDRSDLREAALQALDFLWNEARDAETGSMYRYHDGAPHILGLLGDQSQTARALLDAAEVTGDSAVPRPRDGAGRASWQRASRTRRAAASGTPGMQARKWDASRTGRSRSRRTPFAPRCSFGSDILRAISGTRTSPAGRSRRLLGSIHRWATLRPRTPSGPISSCTRRSK